MSKVKKNDPTVNESTQSTLLKSKKSEPTMAEKYDQASRLIWGFDYELLKGLHNNMSIEQSALENKDGTKSDIRLAETREDLTARSLKVIPLIEAKHVSDRIDIRDLKAHGYLKTRLERIEAYIREQPKLARVSNLEQSKGIQASNLDHLIALRKKCTEIYADIEQKTDWKHVFIIEELADYNSLDSEEVIQLKNIIYGGYDHWTLLKYHERLDAYKVICL